MPTPFPGMDPYLERNYLWGGVHTRLIVAIADELSIKIRPRYRVEIERRTYMSVVPAGDPIGEPDVFVIYSSGASPAPTAQVATAGVLPRIGELPLPEEVTERYLEVREVKTGEVITVIELLSPKNKNKGEGRRQYEEKRLKILGSGTHLVEIDLIRAGVPLPVRVGGNGRHSDYRMIISRAKARPRADVYLFSVRDPIPDIPIPLRPGDVEPILPLNRVLHELYDRAGYDLAIDYSQPPEPRLSPEDSQWAAELIATRLG